MNQAQNACEDLRALLTTTENERNQAQQALQQLKIQVTQLETEVGTLKSSLGDAQRETNRVKETLEDLRTKATTELNQAKKVLEDLKMESTTSLNAVQQTHQLEVAALQDQVAELRNQNSTLNSCLEAAERERNRFQSALDESTARLDDAQRQMENLEENAGQELLRALNDAAQQTNQILNEAFEERALIQQEIAGQEAAAAEPQERPCTACEDSPVTVRLACGHACFCEVCLVHSGTTCP